MENIKCTYKVGDVIKIDYMDDPYAGGKYDGKIGRITKIDDAGQLHGDWGGLAVIPGVDYFHKVVELDEKNLD